MKKTYLTIKLRTNSDIFESGFSKLLTKEGILSLTGDESTEVLGISSTLGSIISSTSLQNLESGEFIGNLTIRDGYFKSSNYEEGVSGWYLGPEVAQLPATYIIGNLQSSNYDPGVAGWLLEQDTGNLYANDIYARGSITTLSGSSIDAQYLINSTIISTLTMGSALTTGYIQSYGWNGSNNGFQIKGGTSPAITVIGGTITGGIVQTSVSGDRIIMNGSTNKIEFKNGDTLYAQMSPYAGGSGSGFEIATHGDYAGPASLILYEGISSVVASLSATSINLNGTTYLNGTTVNAGNIAPATSASYSLGTSSYKFSDIYLSGNVYVAGTVDGVDLSSKASVWDAKMNNPMSTSGDIIYGGSSGTPTRLGIGSDGQVLMVNAIGGISWTTMQHTDLGGVSANQHHSSTSDGLNITPATIVASSYITATGYLTAKSTLYCESIIDMNSHRITNVANPTSSQDAATKAWVEANFEPKA